MGQVSNNVRQIEPFSLTFLQVRNLLRRDPIVAVSVAKIVGVQCLIQALMS